MLPAAALVLSVVSSTAVGTVAIQSEVPCPSADALAAVLRPMINGVPPDLRRLIILPGNGDDALRILLETGSGELLAERTWARGTGDCAGLTEEVAVLAATWLTRVGIEDRPPIELAAAPGRLAAGGSPHSGGGSTEPAVPFSRSSLGLAGGLALASRGSAAPVGMMEVRRSLRSAPALSLAGELWGTGRSTERLAQGEAGWQRAGAALTFGGRTAGHRVAAAADLGVAGSLIFISGSGFPTNVSQLKPEVAIVVEARGIVSPFAGRRAPRFSIGLRMAAGAPRYDALLDGPPDTRRPIPWLTWIPLLQVDFPWPW